MTNPLRLPAVPRPTVRSATRGALAVVAVVAAALVGTLVTSGPSRTIAAAGAPLGAGGEFHPTGPERVFDSRQPSLDVAPFGRKPMADGAASSTFDVPIVGTAGLPAFTDRNGDGQDDNVLAVVVNITVIEPSHLGFLRAFGAGASRSVEGESSIVNFFPNTAVPNTAVLRPGNDGKISIRLVSPTAPGTSHVAIDVAGWFSTSNWTQRGSRVVPVDPARLYDSEVGKFGGRTLGDRAQVEIPIRGARDANANRQVVPDSNQVVGALVNVTGVNSFPGSKPTFFAALPDPVAGNGGPSTSTVNLLPGQFRSNMAIVPVDGDGAITLFHLQGEARLVVDVLAYLEAGAPVDSRAGRVVPLVSPFRAFDTREDAFDSAPLGPAEAEDWSFDAFTGDVKINGEPVGKQSALIGNLTAAQLQPQYPEEPALSFMTAYPSSTSSGPPPEVSNITIREGDTVPNLLIAPYGIGRDSDGNSIEHGLRFYNRAGFLHYVLDVYAVILAD